MEASIPKVSHQGGNGTGIPIFSSEVYQRIINPLGDDDLLTCSLVCRGWCVLARNQTRIRVHSENVREFVKIVNSLTNTFMASLRCIDIIVGDSRANRRLVPLLPRFAALRTLKFWSMGKEDLPALPGLVQLDLAGAIFPSYARFRAFMACLRPTLRNFTFCNVSWESGNPDEAHPFPRFDLESFDLDWGPRPPTEEILFAIRARRVALSFPKDMVDAPFFDLTSRYLRFLGAHLKRLELNCDEQLDQVASVDFSACTGLQTLQISDALRFNVDRRFSVTLSPALSPLLACIAPHCRLRHLILVVQTAATVEMRSWKPAERLVEILDAQNMATVRAVKFRVDGTPFWRGGSASAAHKNCAPLIHAAVPSSASRRIECAVGNGADSDEDEEDAAEEEYEMDDEED
ncbi:hypothetical protein DFH07DRAFT_851252 [Mycena maculata]|uniref:F-box domain-containing protein n=1 Tax=Mycena maculata TaxID=230809 RepID=A0AAD7HUV5_9AGAR|nr:hypothetical protein DFH07DRAFT_851252 [Mycena maculata]